MTFVSILIALILAEVFIRITKEYVTPAIIREKSLLYAASIFARHVFPQHEQNIEGKKEGMRWVINAQGYRGAPFSPKKDANIIRVIVYGGSAVFDQNQSTGDDWPTRVEKLLQIKGLDNVQVINGGTPGHASFDSLGRFFSEGHLYEPDYVLLYNAWNDLKYFSEDRPLLRVFKPFNEKSEFRSTYQGVFDEIFCESSQLYVRLRDRYYRRKYRLGDEGVITDGEYSNQVSASALKQYRLNVAMFVDLAKNIDAVPILLTQARLVAADNSDEDKSRIQYRYQKMQHDTLVDAYHRTDKTVFEVAKSKNVTVIDASSHMTGNGDYFSDHVHLSNSGSKRLAELVANRLAEEITETLL